MPKPLTVTISCKRPSTIDISMYKTGIISLASQCKAYTSSTILSAYDQTYESSRLSIIPPYDMLIDECCSKIKLNETKIKLVPLHSNLNVEELKVASYRLEYIEKVAEQIKDENKSIPQQLYNNAYFSYIICTILKVILIYLAYRLFKYFKRTKCIKNPCCKAFSNCLTLNIFKHTNADTRTELNAVIERENNSNPTTIDENGTQLRRSLRIAQLKDNP